LRRNHEARGKLLRVLHCHHARAFASRVNRRIPDAQRIADLRALDSELVVELAVDRADEYGLFVREPERFSRDHVYGQ